MLNIMIGKTKEFKEKPDEKTEISSLLEYKLPKAKLIEKRRAKGSAK